MNADRTNRRAEKAEKAFWILEEDTPAFKYPPLVLIHLRQGMLARWQYYLHTYYIRHFAYMTGRSQVYLDTLIERRSGLR